MQARVVAGAEWYLCRVVKEERRVRVTKVRHLHHKKKEQKGYASATEDTHTYTHKPCSVATRWYLTASVFTGNKFPFEPL